MLVLHDDTRARTFEPFALTRPLGEVRAGAELLRRRWEIALGLRCSGFVGAAHLADFHEPWAPSAATGVLAAGTIVAHARFAVGLEALAPDGDLWICGDDVAAVRLHAPVPVAHLADGSVALASLAPPHAAVTPVAGRWLEQVWDLIGHLGEMLAEDIPLLASDLMVGGPPAHATVIGQHAVYVEGGAHVEPHTVLDVSAGPILLRKGATVQAFTRLVGPAVVGQGSSVAGDRIACVSIGDVCKIHGEVNTVIVLGHSNKGHDGFVGHSVLGRWVNLGAGTITSNLKNTYGSVALWTPDGIRDSGLQFLGTMFGDHVKTGIGLRLTTGCVIGAGANVFDAMAPKVVAPFAWGTGAPYGTYDLDKFMEVARRMMGRRHVDLTEVARRQLAAAYARAASPEVAARWRVTR